MVRVDSRIQVIEIPTQDVISRDNVSMKVDAVLYFKVTNPEHAIIQVQSYPDRPRICLRKRHCARFSVSTISTKCCRSARSSAPTCRASSTPKPKFGASR